MHLEALPKKSEAIFRTLRIFREFYLVGGTALALQIGHRVSVDFDLFSPKPPRKTLFEKVRKVFPRERKKLLVHSPEQLSVLVDDTKVDFVHYPFPVVLPFCTYEGVRLLTVSEIAATKAYTLGRRPAYRDYVDLYFIWNGNHASLQESIALAQRKYQDAFDPRLFLEQLLYLDDVETTPVTFLKEKVARSTLKRFFAGQIKKIGLGKR